MRRSPPFLVLAFAMAGCLGGTAPEAPAAPGFDADWSERALPFGADHDHTVRAHHAGLSTRNFQVLGHDGLVSAHYGKPAGGYFCGDAAQAPDGRRIAAVESRSEVGFALADVTDPAQPRWLGELVMQGVRVYDLSVVPDGKHVVLVTSEVLQGEILPSVPAPTALWWDSPCGRSLVPMLDEEDPVLRPMSVLLVAIDDPARPRIIDQHPLFGYGHSAFTTILDGRTWLMVSTQGPHAETAAYEFYEIAATPGGGRLQPLGVYKPTDQAEAGTVLGTRAHDGWIQKHPATGKTVAYVSGGNLFGIVDLSDPKSPRLMGRWTDAVPGRTFPTASLHSVFPLPELWGGRHYTLLGPEFATHPEEAPTGVLWVLDTTDPAKIRDVGAWMLPHDVGWSGTYMFSNHYFSVVGRTAFLSLYHGGIWAIDLAAVGTQPFVQLPSIGVFLADQESAQPPAQVHRWTPTHQEVLAFPDGTLVTFDGSSGLYTLRFDPADPAPPPEPWNVPPVTE